MKVTMKTLEKLCNDYRAKFKKNWEFYTLSGDAWLDGFRTAQAEASRLAKENNASFTAKAIREMLSDNVDVELKDGEHQIGAKTSD